MNSNASRKVARAAASGRSSKVRKQIPIGYYSSLGAIVIAGVFVIGYSRYEKTQPTASSSSIPPSIGTKWRVAFGVDVCGKYVPNLPASAPSTAGGLYSSGDGLIQVAPVSSKATGNNANLANFLKGESSIKITSTSIDVQGKGSVKLSTACGGKGAVITYAVWPSLLVTTPKIYHSASSVKFQNDELVAISVLSQGQKPTKPPSEVALVSSPTTSSSVPVATPSSKSSTNTSPGSSSSASSSSVPG